MRHVENQATAMDLGLFIFLATGFSFGTLWAIFYSACKDYNPPPCFNVVGHCIICWGQVGMGRIA
jgi:hypothetical protein